MYMDPVIPPFVKNETFPVGSSNIWIKMIVLWKLLFLGELCILQNRRGGVRTVREKLCCSECEEKKKSLGNTV